MKKKYSVKLIILIAALVLVLAGIVTALSFASKGLAETEQNTFLGQFVVAGGPIVWFVLLPLSVVTLYLVVEHLLTLRTSKVLPKDAVTALRRELAKSNPRQLRSYLKQKDDLLSLAVADCIDVQPGDTQTLGSRLLQSLEANASYLLRKIEWISLIGNVSPMIGLFGTVFGMIKLFNAIVLAGGQPQPAQLAEGISVALVTTFWGLLIAIPALAGHGAFRNKIESLFSEAATEAEKILPELAGYLDLKPAERTGDYHPDIKQVGFRGGGKLENGIWMPGEADKVQRQ